MAATASPTAVGAIRPAICRSPSRLRQAVLSTPRQHVYPLAPRALTRSFKLMLAHVVTALTAYRNGSWFRISLANSHDAPRKQRVLSVGHLKKKKKKKKKKKLEPY